MVNIKIICVGKMKEKFYIDAAAEDEKRLSAYCRLEIIELPEERRGGTISQTLALQREGAQIAAKIAKGSYIIAMCVEGKMYDSPDFSRLLESASVKGGGKICFIIGGSDGLDSTIKDMAQVRLSMSSMTFPHHLARVMLLEQIYRGFNIADGGKYHK